MMSFNPSVCLAVLNWHGRKHLEILIPSLVVAADRYPGECRILILDNPSPAEDIKWLRKQFPQIELIAAPENDYLYSYNWLVPQLEEPIVVFLNNDLKVDKDFLSPLVEPFLDPSVFSVGAQSLEWDGSAVTSAAYRPGVHHGWAYWDGFGIELNEPTYTLFAVGGFMAVDRRKFIELGGFDRLFHPAYGEDIDLCCRAWLQGWTSLYQPKSRVCHREGASWDGGQNTKRGFLMAKAQYLFNARYIRGWGICLKRMIYLWVLSAQKRRSGDSTWSTAIKEARQRWSKERGAALNERPNFSGIDKALSLIGKPWLAPQEMKKTEIQSLVAPKHISVIIPAYNRANLIGETLRSLLNQTLSADEIIIVDDGSTDGTAAAAQTAFEEWKSGIVKCQKVPEFYVIRQENAGPAKARNTGFAVSAGEFIHFFDSDDLAVSNKHEVQVKALRESGADIAYGPWVKGWIGADKFSAENNVLQQSGLPKGDLIRALLTNWSIVPHACLFRRSIVEKVGGFPEHLYGTEDQLMFLNCLLSGARVIHSPGTLELYRTNDSEKITAVGEGQKRHVTNWARFLIDANQVCQNYGINSCRWFGFRQRAWEAIEDLQKFGVEDNDLNAVLKEFVGKWTSVLLYQIHRAIERKWRGLKVRITGNRALASFQAGPFTIMQKLMVQKLGLKLGS